LSQNASFIAALKARLGLAFEIPPEAEYAPALGAALLAAGWGYQPYIDKPVPIFT
jgi:sugar (pentulose or hexulose) kinase